MDLDDSEVLPDPWMDPTSDPWQQSWDGRSLSSAGWNQWTQWDVEDSWTETDWRPAEEPTFPDNSPAEEDQQSEAWTVGETVETATINGEGGTLTDTPSDEGFS